jgi:hypothetical protein
VSPRAKKREVEVEEDDESDELLTFRDFVMARLAAARVSAQAAIEQIDAALGHFVDPDEDKGGTERGELLEGALEAIGEASRGIEAAQHIWDNEEVEDDGEPDLDLDEDEDDED